MINIKISFSTVIELFDNKPYNKEAYAKKIKECMNISMPGAYWQLHHILPESLMYVPSYLLAMIRADELRKQIVKLYGEVFWRSKSAGDYLKSFMKPGAKSKLGTFSNLGNAFNQ